MSKQEEKQPLLDANAQVPDSSKPVPRNQRSVSFAQNASVISYGSVSDSERSLASSDRRHDAINSSLDDGDDDLPREVGASWRSIAIMLGQNFLSSFCFSVVLPSLTPLLTKTLNQTEISVGWAVAFNSAGSFIASPILGYWNDKRSTREVMAFSLIIMALGNIVYALCDKVFLSLNDFHNVIILMTARFVVGFAAGNFAVVQTYFSYATKPSQRTLVMSLNSATSVLGFIIGPACAALMAIGELKRAGVVWVISEHIHVSFNANTLPGYVSALLALLAIISLCFVEELPRNKKTHEPVVVPQPPVDPSKSQPSLVGSIANYAGWATAGSGFYTQTVRDDSLLGADGRRAASFRYYADMAGGGGAAAASGGAEKAAAERARTWTPTGGFGAGSGVYGGKAYVGAGGTINADSGDAHKLSVANYGPSGRTGFLADPVEGQDGIPWLAVIVVLFLYFCYCSSFTVYETIGVKYTMDNPNLCFDVSSNGAFFCLLGAECIIGLVLLQLFNRFFDERTLLFFSSLMMVGGNAATLRWSPPDVTAQSQVAWAAGAYFYLGSALTGIGYSVSTALLISVYSKVLEGQDQGVMMGWLSSAAAVARLIGPLASAYAWDANKGPEQKNPQKTACDGNADVGFANGQYVFLGISSLLMVAALLELASYRLLRPRGTELEEAKKKDEV